MPRGDDDLKLPLYMSPNKGGQKPASPVSGVQKIKGGKVQPVKAQAPKAAPKAQQPKAQPAKTPKQQAKPRARKAQPKQQAKAQQPQGPQLPQIPQVQRAQQPRPQAQPALPQPAKAAPKAQQPGERRAKRKRGIRYGRLAAIAAAAVALIGGAAFLMNQSTASADQLIIGTGQTLPEGVRILGIDVGGDTKAAARSKVEREAEAMAAGAGITISMDGEQYEITGEDISLGFDIESVLQRAMQYDPDNAGAVDVTTGETAGNITSIFTWNSKTLQIALENIADQFDREPSEPTATAQEQPDGTVSFAFRDGSGGRRFNVADSLKYIESMFAAGDFAFAMDGVYESLAPASTAAELQQGFGLRASYSTNFSNDSDETNQNRMFNIDKAASMINGCVVTPGEEWSFNGFIGPRTYETGWKGANGIADGKGYSIQAGGGICQVSTTLYNALLCADVEIVYRRAHSIPSEYVPRGLDATVDSITNIDLKFRNDTGAPLYLYSEIGPNPEEEDENTITFYIYGKELDAGVTYQTRSEVIEYIHNNDVIYTDDDTIPRGYKVVTVEARRGFVVEAYRDRYVNGRLDESELLYTDTYKGNSEEARRGTASPKYYEPPEGAVPIDD